MLAQLAGDHLLFPQPTAILRRRPTPPPPPPLPAMRPGLVLPGRAAVGSCQGGNKPPSPCPADHTAGLGATHANPAVLGGSGKPLTSALKQVGGLAPLGPGHGGHPDYSRCAGSPESYRRCRPSAGRCGSRSGAHCRARAAVCGSLGAPSLNGQRPSNATGNHCRPRGPVPRDRV